LNFKYDSEGEFQAIPANDSTERPVIKAASAASDNEAYATIGRITRPMRPLMAVYAATLMANYSL